MGPVAAQAAVAAETKGGLFWRRACGRAGGRAGEAAASSGAESETVTHRGLEGPAASAAGLSRLAAPARAGINQISARTAASIHSPIPPRRHDPPEPTKTGDGSHPCVIEPHAVPVPSPFNPRLLHPSRLRCSRRQRATADHS